MRVRSTFARKFFIVSILFSPGLLGQFSEDASKIVEVRTDGSEALAILRESGLVTVSGRIDYGAERESVFDSAPPMTLPIPDVAKIRMSHPGFAVLLRDTGEAWGAGRSFFSNLSNPADSDNDGLRILIGEGVIDVVASEVHCLLLKNDGSIWGYSNDNSARLGLENQPNELQLLTVIPDAIEIETFLDDIWILKSDGSFWKQSHLNGVFHEPERIVDSGVASIAAGRLHIILLKVDGSVWTIGHKNSGYALGVGNVGETDTLYEILEGGASRVYGEESSTFVYKDDGSLWAVGDNKFGDIVDFEQIGLSELTRVFEIGVRSIAYGSSSITTGTAYIVRDDGSLWELRIHDSDGWSFIQTEPPVDTKSYRAPIADAGMDIVTSDALNKGFANVILDGRNSTDSWKIADWSWSWNGGEAQGEVASVRLGKGVWDIDLTVTNADGLAATDSVQVEVGDYSSVVAFDTFVNRTLVLKENGSLWGWGSNLRYGALGLPNDGSLYTEMHQVALNADIEDMYIGDESTFLLTTGGGVLAAGKNHLGQLGDGTLNPRDTFVSIMDSGSQSVVVGEDYALIVMEDGSLRMTGGPGIGGQLTPFEIVGSGVVAVAADEHVFYFQNSKGEVFKWGFFGVFDSEPSFIGTAPIFDKMYAQRGENGVIGIDSSNRLWGLVCYDEEKNIRRYNLARHPLKSGEAFLLHDSEVVSFDIDPLSGTHAIATKEGEAYIFGDALELGLDNRQAFSTWQDRWDRVFYKDVDAVSLGSLFSLFKMSDGSVWVEPKVTAFEQSRLSLTLVPPTGGDTRDPGGLYPWFPTDSVKQNTPPIANAGVDQNVGSLKGVGVQQVSLDGTGSSDDRAIASWDWSWDGGSTEGEVAHAFLPVGETEIQLIVTDIDGLSSSDTVRVTVREGSGTSWVGVNSDIYLQTDDGMLMTLLRSRHELLRRSWPSRGEDGEHAGALVPSGVSQTDVSQSHGLIVTEQGELWVFGGNEMGQLGTGFASYYEPPTRMIESGVVSVAVGLEHSLILMDDGSVWTSGRNDHGQLGFDSDGENVGVFTKIIDAGAVQVDAHNTYSVIRMEDGSVRTKGASLWNAITFPNTIVEKGAIDVSAGENAILVLLEDRSLWVVGNANTHWFSVWADQDRELPLWLLDEGPVDELMAGKMYHYKMLDGTIKFAGPLLNDAFGGGEHYDQPATLFGPGVVSIGDSLNGDVAFIRSDGAIFWRNRNSGFSNMAAPFDQLDESSQWSWRAIFDGVVGSPETTSPVIEELNDVNYIVWKNNNDRRLRFDNLDAPSVTYNGVALASYWRIKDESGNVLTGRFDVSVNLEPGPHLLEYVVVDEAGLEHVSSAQLKVASYEEFETWLGTHFSDQEMQEMISLHLDDTDGDGLSNLYEFYFQLTPSDPASAILTQTRIERLGDGLRFTLKIAPEFLHLDVKLEGSQTNYVWQPLPSIHKKDEEGEIVTEFDDSIYRLYRFKMDLGSL